MIGNFESVFGACNAGGISGIALGQLEGGAGDPEDASWQTWGHGAWLYREGIDFVPVACSEDVSAAASLSHPFGDQEDPTGTASVFGAALGSLVTLGVLTVVAVMVRRRRHRPGDEAEHAPLAESEELASTLEEPTGGSSDEQEKMTTAV